ncbi:2-acylglycerol O-acyltransferase 1 [Lingula anatina]|uniref:Acyltransferase n=1 Tax=Lingula anatina TaxID=7574 RepID=A0A1S3JYS2_LINAN|nr:2-acylglycerol O-acyltransferase 1 [Lingula anatina]|eukprot:XP_013415565.1 2-acylglycerol O-acyltransferase 1 [Lingula anatina]
MVKILGIELAPLSIPLERRIQTAVALYWTLTFLLEGFGCLFLLIYLCFTRFYWIPCLYLIWYIYDYDQAARGGRRCEWIRRWKIWEYFRDYFPVKLIKTVDLPPDRNYLFCFHPHGVMCAGAFCNFATAATGFSELFPGLTSYLLVLKGQFQFPLHREYFMTSGACDCTKESLEYLLTHGKGNAPVLVVGGALEALNAHPGKYSLNLSHRKGFVRMAMKLGVPLVPVFSFGENDLFVQVNNPPGSFLRRLQETLMKYCGFSLPAFHGRGVFNYTFGIVPFRKPVNTVVGRPIEVEKNENPSKEQVEDVHAKYVAALQQLFEDNKKQYGLDEMQHIIIQ